MDRYSLKKLVDIAKKKSPFYKNLYKDVKISNFRLSDLPIINEAQFWKANSNKKNQVITDPVSHGILLRSGGTTGKPKTSVFSSNEWNTFCKIMTHNLNKAKFLRKNDCVANMLAYGSLYGGFLIIHDILEKSSVHILELPIGLGLDLNINDAITTIKELQANVIITTPYTAVCIAYYIKSNRIKGINIDRFLYGGDLLLDSQYEYIKSVFPKATITSSGYGSTDAGFLGYTDSTCKMNEFRTDSAFTIIEIVDEKTGEVIEEENIRGRVIVTNLTKALMPVIRYPVGDLAIWCEPKGHKFRKLKLMGRHTKKDDLLSYGGKDYYYQDFYEIIKKSKQLKSILGFQILAKNKKIILKIASDIHDKKYATSIENEIKRIVIGSIPGMDAKSLEMQIVDIFDFSFFTRTYKAIKITKE